MLNHQLEDFITSEELVRYHLLGAGVLSLMRKMGDEEDEEEFDC
ncbi:MAG: hypothetical protein RMX68_016955 [Aulosira sp. ZfuVER01]|nr:hypothetical protein [Aulosira sp. ZfuVER01]MDZ7997387.1 hypothetical protein [Aulosira sp. DedVER01a]MDZ8054219.1 hypothetical protein [Aulosira sp. ZfuCHP01]